MSSGFTAAIIIAKKRANARKLIIVDFPSFSEQYLSVTVLCFNPFEQVSPPFIYCQFFRRLYVEYNKSGIDLQYQAKSRVVLKSVVDQRLLVSMDPIKEAGVLQK
ncbi:hypothetical protein M9H77_29522 [Catharanthus roseus]|uniref:Uncharacterized protein n=1 Tax=Catharanthus roseus TaxID=4058 RepID=A0ACB9ZVP6_CATRO|nr:hypothetical protein M9H77_29522 [Catharanthus roseus]